MPCTYNLHHTVTHCTVCGIISTPWIKGSQFAIHDRQLKYLSWLASSPSAHNQATLGWQRPLVSRSGERLSRHSFRLTLSKHINPAMSLVLRLNVLKTPWILWDSHKPAGVNDATFTCQIQDFHNPLINLLIAVTNVFLVKYSRFKISA